MEGNLQEPIVKKRRPSLGKDILIALFVPTFLLIIFSMCVGGNEVLGENGMRTAGFICIAVQILLFIILRHIHVREKPVPLEEARERIKENMGCEYVAEAVHVDGLPIAGRSPCTVGIAPKYIRVLQGARLMEIPTERITEISAIKNVQEPVDAGQMPIVRQVLSITYLNGKEIKKVHLYCSRYQEVQFLADYWKALPKPMKIMEL